MEFWQIQGVEQGAAWRGETIVSRFKTGSNKVTLGQIGFEYKQKVRGGKQTQ